MPGIGAVASAAVSSVNAFSIANDLPINFIGQHTPTKFRRFSYNEHDTGVPQPETNPHFIGRFKAVHHRLLPGLRQEYPTFDVAPETNPHFVGRFNATTFKISWALRQNEAKDTAPDTPTYFIGKFSPTKFRILSGLRTNPPSDTIVFVLGVVDAVSASDLEFAEVIPPQPCPCAPIPGAGPGTNFSTGGPGIGANIGVAGLGIASNPVVDGPGVTTNPNSNGPGIGSNPVVPGAGPCECD